MRRVRKDPSSAVISQGLQYVVGNSANNKKIKDLLLAEQHKICCYTETYLGRTDKAEIDHFNPTLKDTIGDGYNNWFLVKGQWNNEKSSKWSAYQPVLDPCAADLEERILYFEGDYILANPDDIEAGNLIRLLKLDDPDLAAERKKYIARHKEAIPLYGMGIHDYFHSLLTKYPESVHFLRALKEEFGYMHPGY